MHATKKRPNEKWAVQLTKQLRVIESCGSRLKRVKETSSPGLPNMGRTKEEITDRKTDAWTLWMDGLKGGWTDLLLKKAF